MLKVCMFQEHSAFLVLTRDFVKLILTLNSQTQSIFSVMAKKGLRWQIELFRGELRGVPSVKNGGILCQNQSHKPLVYENI